MLVLHVATLILYLTSCLSLTSGSQANEENGNPNKDLPQDLLKLFTVPSSESQIPPELKAAIRSVSNNETANLSKAVDLPPTLAEKKVTAKTEKKLPIDKSSTNETVVAEGIRLPLEDLTIASDENGKTILRNGDSESSGSIPRKGVNFQEDLTEHETDLEPKNGIDETSTKSSAAVTNGTTLSSIESAKLKDESSRTKAGIKIETSSEKSVPHLIVVSPPPPPNSPVLKHKPKPMVTSGEGDDEQRMPPMPTKKPLLSTPRKIDYIVPIAITVTAVPILAIGVFVLYKRSRDCWDRRHYRRMDFLIDGMYND